MSDEIEAGLPAQVVAWGELTPTELIERALGALADCRVLEDVVEFKARTEAFVRYQKALGGAQELIDAGGVLLVHAQRRIGREIKEAQTRGEVQGRGRPKNSGGVPLISEIGLTHDQSKEYGKLSDATDPVFDAAVEEAKEDHNVTPENVRRLVTAGFKALADLPPDAEPEKAEKAIRAAMREAAGAKRYPTPKEADRLGTPENPVWGSDGRWHDGCPAPTQAELKEFDHVIAVRRGIEEMAAVKVAPERFLAHTSGWDRAHWAALIPPAIEYLRQVGAAFEATRAADKEDKDAA
jgi:hypothetical protein